MMTEYDTVIVRALNSPSRDVTGSAGVTRQPRVGDIGTIVHVLRAGHFVVESVDSDGRTVWLADFVAGELAPPPSGWSFVVEEVSAGVYKARCSGPKGENAEITDSDPTAALAACREFALRHSE